MDDQRRGLDGWHDGTDVDLEGHPHERNGIVRARGFDLEAAGELAEALVAGTARREVVDSEALAPALDHPVDVHRLLESLPRVLTPRPVVRRFLLDLCAAEHERPGAFGVGGTEEERHRPSFRDAHRRRPPRAWVAKNPPHVVLSLFERADANAVREAHAAFVEQDEP